MFLGTFNKYMIVTLTRFSCEWQWRRKQTESGGGGARLIKNLDKHKIPKPLTVTMVTLTLFYAGHI